MNKICEVETFEDILNRLMTFTPEQLAQKPMILLGNSEPVPLGVVIALDTVEKMESETRSYNDNQHHPEQMVFLCDRNLYTKYGDMALSFTDTECEYCHKVVNAMRGETTGRIYVDPHECIPERMEYRMIDNEWEDEE